jgi:hypothetical protein
MAMIKVNMVTTEGELLDTLWVTDEPFEGMRPDVVHLDDIDAMKHELFAWAWTLQALIKVNVTTTEGELLDTFWATDEPFEGMRHDVIHLGDEVAKPELVSYLRHSIGIVNTREQAEG